VPAAPKKRVNKRAMLLPKEGDPYRHIPTIMDFSEFMCPAERRALREIVQTAEVVRENGHVYILARVSADTLDSLAAFETSRADLEEDGSEEPEESDYELGGTHATDQIDWARGSGSLEEKHDGCEPGEDAEPKQAAPRGSLA
jgi:hypothetical protein